MFSSFYAYTATPSLQGTVLTTGGDTVAGVSVQIQDQNDAVKLATTNSLAEITNSASTPLGSAPNLIMQTPSGTVSFPLSALATSNAVLVDLNGGGVTTKYGVTSQQVNSYVSLTVTPLTATSGQIMSGGQVLGTVSGDLGPNLAWVFTLDGVTPQIQSATNNGTTGLGATGFSLATVVVPDSTATGANAGLYYYYGKPGEPVTVSVSVPPPNSQSAKPTYTFTTSSQKVTLPDSTQVNFTATVDAAISGTVAVGDLPLSGVGIDLLRDGQPVGAGARTDLRGRYHFVGLAPGFVHGPRGPCRDLRQPAGPDGDAGVANPGSATHVDFRHGSLTQLPTAAILSPAAVTVGSRFVNSVGGSTLDPAGRRFLDHVEVSVQDQDTGWFWNGQSFVSSPVPIVNRALGAANWTMPLPAGELTAGHTYVIQSQAFDVAGGASDMVARHHSPSG